MSAVYLKMRVHISDTSRLCSDLNRHIILLVCLSSVGALRGRQKKKNIRWCKKKMEKLEKKRNEVNHTTLTTLNYK